MHSASRILAGALLLAAPAAFAQSSATVSNVPANAKIIKGITLLKTADLAFGDIVTGLTSGTVALTPAGVRTPSGGPTLAVGGPVTAAAFDVTGKNNKTYAITVPGTPVTLTDPVSSATMTVTSFVSSLGATGTLSGTGTQSFTVGGTLNVGASQTEGDYAGTFSVTVAYN